MGGKSPLFSETLLPNFLFASLPGDYARLKGVSDYDFSDLYKAMVIK